VPPLKDDESIADGSSVRDWLRRLRSPVAAQSLERTALTLQVLGPDAVVVKGLAECLAEPDPEVRDQVTSSLCRFGPSAKDAVPLLLALLKHKHRGTRHSAAEALRAIDPKAGVK
jgi:HEAT repeat protein